MALVVDQDLFPVAWGDVNLCIALDQPANRRDMEVWVGDDFAVVAQIFVHDGDDEPLMNFGERTVEMIVGQTQIPPGNTIEGVVDPGTGQVLFDLTDIDWSRYWGRTRFIIKMSEAGRSRTIAQGYVAVYGNVAPCAWPNDYGFSWGGGL